MKRRSYIKGLILACVTAPAIVRAVLQPPKIELTTAQLIIEHWRSDSHLRRFHYTDEYRSAIEQVIMSSVVNQPSRIKNPSIAADVIPKL
jgi:hypothetical protein